MRAALIGVLLVLAAGARAQEPDARVDRAIGAAKLCDAALNHQEGARLASGVACFYGPISKASAAEFLALAAPDDALLVLRSGGGDVDSGLQMADYIADHRIHVVVWQACLSSCANYLFIAGATKIVLPGSLVGWHGGPPRVPPSSLADEAKDRLQRLLDHQRSFFARIGVKEDLLYTPPPGSLVTRENRDTRFWTWDAERLASEFGVRGIVFMGRPAARIEIR